MNASRQGTRTQVAVVGGGFGGLQTARSLRKADVDVLLIDRRNFHLFQPLLYQVATGGLSPANIAAPLRGILARQKNVRVLKANVTGFDVPGKQILTSGGSVAFDYLVVAPGSTHSYFGNKAWREAAGGLKTVEEALAIRRQVLNAFEVAEHVSDERRRAKLLTFVLVGGGPTGVELAGALSELAHHTLPSNFRQIDTRQVRIVLIEAGNRLLSSYDPQLSDKARKSLERLHVEVRLQATVTEIEQDAVHILQHDRRETIATPNIIWAAGVKASPLGKELATSANARVDKQGCVFVNPDLSVGACDHVFVIGDLAHAADESGNRLPGVAPVAMQQGNYVARLIRDRLAGRSTPPFRYLDLGSMAVIGRSAAVAQRGRLQLHGYFAWLAWLFIHLINLVEFQSRVLVLFQWAWNYVTRNKSARLITNEEQVAETDGDEKDEKGNQSVNIAQTAIANEVSEQKSGH